MTGAQTLAAFRRAVFPALAVGVAMMALVMGLLLSRPQAYSARIGLVASAADDKGSAGDFGSVVATTMPALPELAVSDGTINAVRDQVPDAPDAGTLRKSITVELVPASGVARISVQTDNQATTIQVLKVLVAQIQAADLLAPVAVLKPIGSGTPSAQLVERDPQLAVGIGLVAAVVSSLLMVVLVQTLSPRLLTPLDVERVVDEVFEGSPTTPPVVDLKKRGSGLNLLAAHLLSQNPSVTEVTVVPTGPPWRGDLARQLRGALRTLRVARDVGLPATTFASADVTPAMAAAMADWAARPFEGGVLQTSPIGLPAEVIRGAEQSNKRRGPQGGGIVSTVDFSQNGSAEPTPSHLVVTVRLGRTTPVALTTALIALRTHGTGVAGLAVN
jgi:hypothetical protein